jgi:hypothetical protein
MRHREAVRLRLILIDGDYLHESPLRRVCGDMHHYR